MNLAYIVSMFPCWSETFVLNEIMAHTRHGESIHIFSLKECSEDTIQDQAKPYIRNTTYPKSLLSARLLLDHFMLFCRNPAKYLSLIVKLATILPFLSKVQFKSLVVFWQSPWFIREATRQKFTHIHAHFATYPALMARIISDFTNIPYSFTAHAHDIYIDRSLLPLVAKRSKFIATISRFNKTLIQSALPWIQHDSIVIVHCGVDLNQYPFDNQRQAHSLKAQKVKILSVGRLSGIKGFPYLLETLSQLKTASYDFICHIVGDGPDRLLLESRRNELGLEEQVMFVGVKKSGEVRRYMEDADVFVLCSAPDPIEGHDGIPVVFMEAMALGTPVIGTALSGIPELIIHRHTGLLAQPEDPTSMSDVFQYFLENPDEVEIMRRNARKHIEEQFDVFRNAHQLREAFFR